MRECPKCGERYSDTDFRTMCGNCLVNLVAVSENLSLESMSQAGPITMGGLPIGPISSATITSIELPTINVPPPLPDIPPVDIIPPNNHSSLAYTPLPAPPANPGGQDVRTPAPTPLPPVAAPRPTGVSPSLAPPVIPSAAPRPARVGLAPPPAAPATPMSSGMQIQGSLSPDEIASSKSAISLTFFGSAVATMLALVLLFSMMAGHAGFFTLFALAILVVLAVILLRQTIYRSFVQSVIAPPQRPNTLGAPIEVNIVIGLLRPLPIDGAMLTISAVERVEYGNSGRSVSADEHRLLVRQTQLAGAATWPGGSRILLTATVELPDNAIPTFLGNKHQLRWQADLWVSTTGWLPDIRLRIPLLIAPVRVRPPAPAAPRVYELAQLNGYDARLTLTCPVSKDQYPFFPIERDIPYTLAITPREENRASRISLEVGYMVEGGSELEIGTLMRVWHFQHGWPAGRSVQESGNIRLPYHLATPRTWTPISYGGSLVRIKWQIVVKVDSTWPRPQICTLPVTVAPAEVEEQ